jgi:hypothetical protein
MNPISIGLRAALSAALVVSSTKTPGDPLAWAFRFASAIVSDPKDMGKAQEAVVWDYTSSQRWEEAEAAAAQVEGWRRGTAYADLATALAKAGKKDQARAMIAKAEAHRATVEGWQNPRIAAHVANAYAALGDVEKANTLARAVAIEDAQQYAGRAAATKASGLAAQGNAEAAEAELAQFKGTSDIEDLWWRMVGYVEIARQTTLPKEKRLEALGDARKAAASIPGWKRAEALESIAEAYDALGAKAEAKSAVAEAESIVTPLPDTMPIKAALLSNCARTYGKVGDKESARRLLGLAETCAASAQPIDRPTVYANTAASFASVGEKERAKQLFGKALDEATGLVNARPRALAVVEICRSMSKASMPLDPATRQRLESLYAGLKDPW